MSRFFDETVACPSCGHTEVRSIAISITISDKTIFKQQILAGEFQRFDCSACSKSYSVDDPFIYMDFHSKLMIAQFPKSWNRDWKKYEGVVTHNFEQYLQGTYAAASARRMSEGFKLRTVFGLEALAEKIVCMEHGLDDELLSILKFQMIESINGLQFHPALLPIFRGMTGSELVFAVSTLDSDGHIIDETICLPFPLAMEEVIRVKTSYDPIFHFQDGATYIDPGRIWYSTAPV